MHVNQSDPDPELLIKFVSLPPGAGKTTAAIEMMVRHLQGTLEMKRVPKYVFYVAATKYLLNQTAENLQRALGKRKARGQIRMAYSDRGGDDTFVQEQVKNIINGRSNNGAQKQAFDEGSILFMTHEAFLMLDLRHSRVFAETLVLFDEARKWANMMSPLVMDDRAMDFFNRLFDARPMRDGAGAVVPKISELVAKEIPENQKVAALKGCGKKAVRAFKELDALHRAMNVPEGTPTRMRAYAFFEKGRGRSAANNVMIQVKLPSFPFNGFSDVLILSADFKTSQMYCFLRDEGTRVVNKSQWFMNTFHPAGYTKAISSVVKRYDYIDIIALNTDPSPPAIGRYHNGGLMVPRSRMLELGNLLAEWNMNGTQILKCIQRVRNPLKETPSAGDKAKVKFLVEKLDAKTNMLKWMVNRSHEVIRNWRKANPCKEQALLFLNKDFQDTLVIDKKLFNSLNHAETVGDNRWSGSNAVAFLAAINPDPHMARLLKARLGYLGYDPHEDFIVDKVIQAAGRGNIRTHGIKDRMLIVVPTENLAQRVAERMNDTPEILSDVTEELGNYTSWNHRTYRTTRAQVEKPKIIKRVRRTLTAEEKLKERALYQAAYRAKKDGDLELYAELEARRDAIRFESK